MRIGQLTLYRASWRLAERASPLTADIIGSSGHVTGRSGSFDKNFPAPKVPVKAWNGQNKDKFFRDKYAHVHVQQKIKQEAEYRSTRGLKPVSAYKAARSFSRNKARRRLNQAESGKAPKKASEKVQKTPDYKIQLNNPVLEYIYGTQAVLGALQNPQRDIFRVFTQYGSDRVDERLIQMAEDRMIEVVYDVPKQTLNQMSRNNVHNGYVVETRTRVADEAEFVGIFDAETQQFPVCVEKDRMIRMELQAPDKKRFPLGLFLDEITDVHNFGAILRSAYFLGVDFVAYHSRNGARLSPAVAKTSSGALDHIQLLRVADPMKFFQSSQEASWRVVASTLRPVYQDKNILPSQLHELLESGPCILVLGSESNGVGKPLLKRADFVVTLDGSQDKTKVDSLNVSVASALILSKFFGDGVFDA